MGITFVQLKLLPCIYFV